MADVVLNPLSILLQSLGVAIKTDEYCREKLEPSFNAFKSEFDAAEARRQEAKTALQPLMELTRESLTASHSKLAIDHVIHLGALSALNTLWTETLSSAIEKLKTLLAG